MSYIYIYIYIYIYLWLTLAIGTHRKLTCRMKLTSELVLYSARTENAYVEWDWLQHSYSIRHSQKAHVKWDWLQVSCSIRHRHKMHMYSKATTSLVLCSVRIENSHAESEIDYNTHSIRHAQNCICQVRLNASLALYLTRTENAHVEWDCLQHLYPIRHAHVSKIDFKSRTLFGTLRNLTCHNQR